MKKSLTARHNAFKQVALTLNNNNSKTSKIPAMAGMVSELDNLVDKTSELITKVGSVPDKTAGNKNLAQTELIGISSKVSNIVKVYAFISKNDNLNNLIGNNTNSNMLRLKNQEVLDYAKNLLTTITPLASELANYGLTEEMATELEAEINDYEKLMAEPRQLISERKTTNELIEDHIDQIQSLLANQIDPMMELFAEDKEFYLSYKSARMIVDPATRKQAEINEAAE